MSTPSVSVLMPAHNVDRYVARAIESILEQTYQDFEFIIVDDGSADRTRAIAECYAAKDARIRLLSRSQTGIVGALNDGLALTSGRYLARMDADDVALPHRFERQVAYLEASPEVVAVGSWIGVIDPAGLPQQEAHRPTEHEEIDRIFLSGRGGAIVHPAAMMRLDAVRQIGGYDPAYQLAEDLDLFLRLAERGRLANLPEVLLLYREHLQSTTNLHRSRQLQIAAKAAHAARKRRGLSEQTAPLDADESPTRGAYQAAKCRSWALRAIHAGDLRVARRHAYALVRRAPLRFDTWRVLRWAICG